MLTMKARPLTLATHIAAAMAAVVLMQLLSGAAQAMSGYDWKMRPLFVFAASDNDAQLAEQQERLNGRREGLVDRDMAIILVIADSVRTSLGPDPGQTASQLRERFGISPDAFATILVGKDGGTKLRSKTPVTTRRLFALIDSMPMRRQEMQKR